MYAYPPSRNLINVCIFAYRVLSVGKRIHIDKIDYECISKFSKTILNTQIPLSRVTNMQLQQKKRLSRVTIYHFETFTIRTETFSIRIRYDVFIRYLYDIHSTNIKFFVHRDANEIKIITFVILNLFLSILITNDTIDFI